jgi:N-acetylmuramoyl-L-alanine amidase
MSSREKAIVTNFWSKVLKSEETVKSVSRVVIESNKPVHFTINQQDAFSMNINLMDACLTGTGDLMIVEDGLIQQIEVIQEKVDFTKVMLQAEYPLTCTVKKEDGVPAKIIIDFDRTGLANFYCERKIIIDPGHGGKDTGARGPINLLEKHIVLEVAGYLENLFRQAGAKVHLTRNTDTYVPEAQRLQKTQRADIFLSLHTFGANQRQIAGTRTLYHPASGESSNLGKLIHAAILKKVGLFDRGLVADVHVATRPPHIPSVWIELVTISNPVEEGWLRDPVFKKRLAESIFNGVTRYFYQQTVAERLRNVITIHPGNHCLNHESAGFHPGSLDNHAFPSNTHITRQNEHKKENAKKTWLQRIPLRTHLLSEKDDIVEVITIYTRGIAEPGDMIAVSESVVAITQGRIVLPEEIIPGMLANFLCRFPGKDGSLATPHAMQVAINEVGRNKILLGALAAGFGKMVCRKGDFYRVAGRDLSLIDDIAGTMPPYDKHIVLGPKNSHEVVSKIKEATGIDALVVDVNNARCVDIIATTAQIDPEVIRQSLLDNPFGNNDQRTPIVVIKAAEIHP